MLWVRFMIHKEVEPTLRLASNVEISGNNLWRIVKEVLPIFGKLIVVAHLSLYYYN